MKPSVNIMWFRRDLRLSDNAALYHVLKNNSPVVPVFVFDKHILDELENKQDRRVIFIHQALEHIQQQLLQMGSTLQVFYGTPLEMFQSLLQRYSIEKVFTNHDYEKYAIERDGAVAKLLQENGASFHSYKDHVIFEKHEVVKDDRLPYTVFTPYSKRWKATLTPFHLKPYPTEKYFSNFYKQKEIAIPSLPAMGFKEVDVVFPIATVKNELLKHYKERRDFPGVQGTSHLGIHLRFGTVSIRALANQALAVSETFLNELIWRDFYQMILFHFPHISNGLAFRKEYDLIEWRNNEKEFQQWCEGKTGYPIVDAGMRELNATGYMHNRVRMIVASFLTKHLLIDWRWGEAYFAKQLDDFDFAANNGGWQWAAGSGCDAAPYFRVFNPTLQTEKFDKELQYIKKWVPELNSFEYPQPIVPHEQARKRCLEVYGKVLKKG
ncbi:MAG: deoxyribodipyrimidine photo-lyase [Bacteroidota bacterium]|nr:deoxyribodipyrimidine photo-lyase [Bacteroidota bacterium]